VYRSGTHGAPPPRSPPLRPPVRGAARHGGERWSKQEMQRGRSATDGPAKSHLAWKLMRAKYKEGNEFPKG